MKTPPIASRAFGLCHMLTVARQGRQRVDWALTHAAACGLFLVRENEAQRGGDFMAVYTIIRVYEVTAKDRIEATNVMMEALALGVETDFLVKDIIREPDGKPGTGRPVDLRPPKGFLAALLAQLTGRA